MFAPIERLSNFIVIGFMIGMLMFAGVWLYSTSMSASDVSTGDVMFQVEHQERVLNTVPCLS